MRINLISLIILLVFFFSCKPPKEEEETVPSNILSEEQFITVLTDAYLAEGASGINIKNVAEEKFDSTYLFNPLKDNNISKSKFDSALTYYTQRPKKLKLIYDKILEKLSFIQASRMMGNSSK